MEYYIHVYSTPWLYHKRERWSESSMIPNKEEIDSEKNSKFIDNPVATYEPVTNIERFSSWRKLLRVTAYVMRIASKNDREKSEGTGAHLKAEGIKKAERLWVLEAQEQIDEKCWKQVEKLSPFKDEEGVIRSVR